MFCIAKRFTLDAGHRLSKHPELCRFPHGHSYEVEVVVAAKSLDAHDMVCDCKALKTVLAEEFARLDHAMQLSSGDPQRGAFGSFGERVVLLEQGDPTAEVLARRLFERVRELFRPGMEVATAGEPSYAVPDGVRVERVRVAETPTTRAECGE